MKIKTAELTGAALDRAVAKAQGLKYITQLDVRFNPKNVYAGNYRPSENPAQAWPIIEAHIGNLWKRAKINDTDPEIWFAVVYNKQDDATLAYCMNGPTPLIACLRAYVLFKLGEEVDVPEELS